MPECRGRSHWKIHATAIGETAGRLQQPEVGQEALFQGFLGKQRSGRGVMFHISSFQPFRFTSAP